GIGSQPMHAPANNHGGIETGRAEQASHDGRGRGLAVGAGNGDAVLEPHQLGEHFRPRDHGDPALARHLDLNVVARDGRGVHDDVGALPMGGLVAGEDLVAETLQALDGLATPAVRAADAVAHVEHHLGDSAHPGSADAHEVNLPVLFEHDSHALPACWEMLSSTPAENIVMSSAEPPKNSEGGFAPLPKPPPRNRCAGKAGALKRPYRLHEP